MHIALVHRDLHDPARGGVCTLYTRLAEQFIRLGHRVTLVGQQSPNPLRLDNAETILLPRTEDLDRHRRDVADLVMKLDVDVAECSSWESELLELLRRPRHTRPTTVVRSEFACTAQGASPEMVAAERELIRNSDLVLAVSRFASSHIDNTYGRPADRVVYNGVDSQRFRKPKNGFEPWNFTTGSAVTLGPAHEGIIGRTPAESTIDKIRQSAGFGPTAIWCGKITPAKGWDLLEQAILTAPEMRFVVLLGHAPAISPVTIQNAPNVSYLQDVSIEDMPEFFASATALLTTSRVEGFGLAIAEAAACGTPVIAPRALEVVPEFLTEGRDALFFDSASEVADRLRNASSLTPRLPEHIDWRVTAEQSLQAYGSSLAQDTPRRGLGS